MITKIAAMGKPSSTSRMPGTCHFAMWAMRCAVATAAPTTTKSHPAVCSRTGRLLSPGEGRGRRGER